MARIRPTLGPPSVILGLHTLCNANRPKSSQVSFNLLFFLRRFLCLSAHRCPLRFCRPLPMRQSATGPEKPWKLRARALLGRSRASRAMLVLDLRAKVVARGRQACSAEYVMLHRVLRAPRHVHVTSQLGTLHLDVVSGLTFFSLWSCSYETETLKSLLPLLSAATKSTPIGYPVEKDCPLIITPFVCKPSIMPFPASSSFV